MSAVVTPGNDKDNIYHNSYYMVISMILVILLIFNEGATPQQLVDKHPLLPQVFVSPSSSSYLPNILSRSSRSEFFCEKVFLKISRTSQGNTYDLQLY